MYPALEIRKQSQSLIFQAGSWTRESLQLINKPIQWTASITTFNKSNKDRVDSN